MTKEMYEEIGNTHPYIMAMGDDVQRPQTVHKKAFHHHQSRDVEQVLDCVRKDGCRYYKIRWRDTWESEDCLGPFHKFIKEFWDKVEKSRQSYQQHQIHNVPHQNGHSSPPLRNADSPSYPEDAHHSPIYKHESEETVEVNNTIEKEECVAEDDNRVLSSSPPTLSSGRRKGKPKKLVNHVERSPSPPVYNNNNNNIISNNNNNNNNNNNTHSPPYLTTLSDGISKKHQTVEDNVITRYTPPRSEKDLIVEIPDTTSGSPRSEGNSTGSLEEYPVMIIRENGEEPVMGLKEQHKPHSPYVRNYGKRSYSTSPNCTRPSPDSDHFRHLNNKEHIIDHHLQTIAAHTPPNTSPEDNADHHHHQPPAPLSPVFQRTTLRPIPQHARPHHNGYSPPEKIIKSYHAGNPPPMIFHSRVLPHARKGHLVNPHYIYADPRHPMEGEKVPEKLADSTTKLETSQLLLKVTGPNAVTTNMSSLPNDHHQQFPVYQTTKAPTATPTPPKKRAKESTVKGRKTPTKYLTTADGEQRPQCSECFQTFKKRAALERHMMIHRGIKPFQCHFCNQRFRQKHHLQGHIMLHTGERPHSCTLCNKRFRMRHHLLEHERISHKVFR